MKRADQIAALANMGRCFGPSFSPDGTEIAFVSDLSGSMQGWRVDVGGGWPHRITTFDDAVLRIEWSPRGDELAVLVAPGGGMNREVYLVSPDGSRSRRLTDGGKENNRLGQWTPDGKFLLITSNRRDQANLDTFLVDVDGNIWREIARTRGASAVMDVSRDRRRVLLWRLEPDGDQNLYVLELERESERLITPHRGKANFDRARFRSGDHDVYFLSDIGREFSALMGVSAESPSSIEVLVERDCGLELFDLAPDGSATYARDALGSIRAELLGGTTLAAWRYRVYGDVAQFTGAATPTLLGYAGQLFDPSGLYYMRARWYDAATGRFLTRDSLVGDATAPAALNAYAYAHANPIVNSDPLGLFCVGAGIGGNLAMGTLPWFGSSRGGGAGSASFGFVVCGGGRSGLNVGFVGSVGGFFGKPDEVTGVVPAKNNEASGAFAGGGFFGLVSPNATKTSDFHGAFDTTNISVGCGPAGSVEYSAGRNEDGDAIDVITVSPPFAGYGCGGSLSHMQTWSETQPIWSQSGGWLRE